MRTRAPGLEGRRRKALVSVITPNFNREEYVSATLESLLEQTLQNWECVIVDDGSEDDSPSVIGRYVSADSRFRYLTRTREPKGPCTCRNLGVDYSQGEYLIFLDTDDLLEPFCLEQRVRVMDQNPDLDFAIFPGMLFEETPHDLELWWNVDNATDQLTRQFRQDAICQGTGVIWRKGAFNRVGRWDESLTMWQDIDLFFRAYIGGYKFAKSFDLPPDLHNRRNPSSLSRKGFFAPEKIASRVVVIKRAVELLHQHGKSHYLREARYMVAETASGMARSGDGRGARKLISWALRSGVLRASEARQLRQLALLQATRLGQLPVLRGRIRVLSRLFSAESTLGAIHYRSGGPGFEKSAPARAIHAENLRTREALK